jgi:hypothetical protein
VERAANPRAFAWTDELLALLGLHPDRVVAERAGVVVDMRRWLAEEVALLGTAPDAEIADHHFAPRLRPGRERRARVGLALATAGASGARARGLPSVAGGRTCLRAGRDTPPPGVPASRSAA